MSWVQVIFVSLFTTVLILTLSGRMDGASVPENKATEGQARRVFMPEADASTFFKSPEQRVRLAAGARRREINEEQRNKHENYAEEVHDELNERSRERTEQWREFQYDGLYPRYDWRN
ncbi:hypothetical protein NHX12_020217 [Muraenolepis orangiensis]|uniref:Unique cartilage matrix-associated protein n=1 Tax=Muraenolepis orangiensis TaxID=630683 RepID=A0A9Q0IST8_9TELE|nr:hypothetical protein NHX12_020217 [Muraenolepis orangiensis]